MMKLKRYIKLTFTSNVQNVCDTLSVQESTAFTFVLERRLEVDLFPLS